MTRAAGSATSAVHAATQARNKAKGRLEDADDAWRSAIKRALAVGVPARTVAAEAGVTPERIYQIARNSR